MSIDKELLKQNWIKEHGPFEKSCYANPDNNSDYYHWGCCCRCEFQIEIRKHPWNGEPFKGSIMDVAGWACVGTDMVEGESKLRAATYMDRKHGQCEIYKERKENEQE
jgi:hypothetical protein